MQAFEKRRIILSCLSGNVLEWFDFAVYGYVAITIAPLFFPTSSPFASLLLSYSVFALGFFARPLGSIGFGYIGDRLGRKTALVWSSFLMAIPTFCIGLLPTYEQIGIWAPILLLLCRIFQGLSVGGEYTGSFVYLVETAPKGEKGRMGCWADIGCFLGTMMGTLSVALLTQTLSQEAFTSYGWRIPFFAGILLGVVGFFMRKSLRESNDFTKSPTIKHPIHHLLTKQRRLFFASIALIALNAMGFYMITVFIGNQTIALGKIPASEAYALNAFALLCITVATLTIARFVDTYDTVKLYKIGCFASAVLAYPLFYSLVYGSMAMQIVLMGLFSIAISFTFAPRSYFLVNTFSPATRFTAVALCMSIANAVFGGMTPLVATTLIKESGITIAPFTMIIIAAAITWFAINVISREKIKISHSKHLDKAA